MNKSIIKEISNFTGWNTLGALAVIGRNQGVVVLLNVFFGTAINAVYGIANQVSSQLSSFSQMMTSSMAPQIMKSKGEDNNDKMLYLSIFTSKISFFLFAFFAIPLLLKIDFVLYILFKSFLNLLSYIVY